MGTSERNERSPLFEWKRFNGWSCGCVLLILFLFLSFVLTLLCWVDLLIRSLS